MIKLQTGGPGSVDQIQMGQMVLPMFFNQHPYFCFSIYVSQNYYQSHLYFLYYIIFQVNQDLYDTLTRWFSMWRVISLRFSVLLITVINCTPHTNRTSCILQQHVNNGQISGCYNSYCPGFVVTTTTVALNAYFPNESQIYGDQYEFRTSIVQVKFT